MMFCVLDRLMILPNRQSVELSLSLRSLNSHIAVDKTTWNSGILGRNIKRRDRNEKAQTTRICIQLQYRVE